MYDVHPSGAERQHGVGMGCRRRFVGGVHDDHAPLCLRGQRLQDGGLRGDVHPGRGLVNQQDIGAGDEALAKQRALALAAGHRRQRRGQQRGQPEELGAGRGEVSARRPTGHGAALD
nr:hypothetical protein [Klenkia marina]